MFVIILQTNTENNRHNPYWHVWCYCWNTLLFEYRLFEILIITELFKVYKKSNAKNAKGNLKGTKGNTKGILEKQESNEAGRFLVI